MDFFELSSDPSVVFACLHFVVMGYRGFFGGQNAFIFQLLLGAVRCVAQGRMISSRTGMLRQTGLGLGPKVSEVMVCCLESLSLCRR